MLNFPRFNKKFLYGNFLMAAVLLVAFFISVNYVLAADNNTQVPACKASQDNCDVNSTACTNHTLHYLPYDGNTYANGNGHPNCCGDDSNEFEITSYCPGYFGGLKCCNSSANCEAICNQAPNIPSNPSLANNITCISLSPARSGSGGDPDGYATTPHGAQLPLDI